MDRVTSKLVELMVANENNLNAYDDDLETTWETFKEKFEELKEVVEVRIKSVENWKQVRFRMTKYIQDLVREMIDTDDVDKKRYQNRMIKEYEKMTEQEKLKVDSIFIMMTGYSLNYYIKSVNESE